MKALMRVLLLLLAYAAAVTTTLFALLSAHGKLEEKYVVHEDRSEIPNGGDWKGWERVGGNVVVPLSIALRQRELGEEEKEELLMGVADPQSKGYGKWYSKEEVEAMFQPERKKAEEVKIWLTKTGGVDEGRVGESEDGAWMYVDGVKAKEYEELFRTELWVFEHQESGQRRIGVERYSVPRRLRKYIDYVRPGVKLSASTRKEGSLQGDGKKSVVARGGEGKARKYSRPAKRTTGGVSPELADCDHNITHACIRALYDIPEPTRNDSINSLGIYQPYFFQSQPDLDLLFTKYAPHIPNGTAPLLASIDGGNSPVNQSDEHNDFEPAIEIQMAIPLIYPQTVTLYQTDDGPQAYLELHDTQREGFLNTFLDALDGSYCDYSAYGESGDEPGIDAEYPDPRPGGYNGSRQCGTFEPTRVISISYSETEAELPTRYQRRQCDEFLKLGLQGYTILVSTGDGGVGAVRGNSTHNKCLSGCGLTQKNYKPGDNCPYENQNGTIYAPTNPGNCPWVTSVGGTQINRYRTIFDPETALQYYGTKINYSSAGGFANCFTRPRYQKDMVDAYFAHHDPGSPFYYVDANGANIGNNGGVYNRGGRGYPDISANGNNFLAFANGTEYSWSGTSISTPLWGAIVTLINQERNSIGKGPVGFINPVLYQNPGVFTDITNGSNPNCKGPGFNAVAGWDPVTGLGTPKYPELLKLFLSLP